MGKHQNAAGIRVGLDLDGALQSDPRLVEGGLCNGQRPFQSQPCRGETVLLQVRRCDVQRHAGASDWLDRHNGPPFAKINPTVDGIIPDGRGLWIAVMIGGIGKGAESMI